MEPDEIIDLLEEISITNIKRFFIGESNTFVFTSYNTIDELYDKLNNGDGHLYMLMEFKEENVKIKLPKKVVEFLKSDDLEDEFPVLGLVSDNSDMNDYILNQNGRFEGAIDLLTMNEMSPDKYVKALSDEEKDEHIDTLLAKMPNLNEWEQEVLKELTK